MKKILCLVFVFGIVWGSACKDKKFSIVIGKQESFKTILEQLAQECFFSVIFKDKISAQILDDKGVILNFYQTKVEKILKTGFEAFDLSYTLQDDVISISHLETKTFFIHYISTSRVASSNTNIVFSQDVAQNNFSTNPSISEGDNHQRVIDIANQQDDFSSKSGSKIYSLDAIDFWGGIEKELKEIVFRENDRYKPQDSSNPIVINKASGFVTITASPSQIKRAQEYIKSLNKKLSTQVLIDVSILTVSHRNNKTTGIDWSSIYSLGVGGVENNPLISFNSNAFDYGVNIFSQDLTIGKIIEFLNTYGDVNSISNPKILTLNNQPALISVGNVIRYTQNLVYQTSNNTTTLQNTRQQYPSVFSGVLLDITPSIDGDYIILKINPSITATKDSKIENEADALLAPPNLSTNQISSIVRLKNDQKVVLGGLISKLQMKQQKRVPILGYIPVVKYLFSHTRDLDQSQEMVIVITPKIINFEEQ